MTIDERRLRFELFFHRIFNLTLKRYFYIMIFMNKSSENHHADR